LTAYLFVDDYPDYSLYMYINVIMDWGLRMTCSKAPGKIVLFGEHFVVKGAPAVGFAVSKYAKVCVEDGSLNIISKQTGRIEPDSLLYRAVKRLITKVNSIFECSEDVKILIDSEIPIGSGMGSSAALSVALAHAYLTHCNVDFDKKLVNEIAYEAEKEVHSKPSGIDNTLATFGGFLKYRSGVFEKLEVRLGEEVYFLVVNTNLRRQTGKIVEEVLKLYEKYPEILENVYNAASALVEKALKSLEERDYESIGRLMLLNHGLLWTIGVSHEVNDLIVHKLVAKGCLGAKLSGAGKGGIVIGLVKGSPVDKIEGELRNEGFEVFRVAPDYEGVRNV